MAWIDYKKAFDMVPHSWILQCLRMFGVAQNMIDLIKNSMSQWTSVLTAGNEERGEVQIKRGIFQGDSLSLLLFVVSLIPLSLVLQKVKAGYDLCDKTGVVNPFLFMDDLELQGKTKTKWIL